MSRKGHRCGTAIVVVAGLSHALQPASGQAGAVGAGGSLALTVTGFATVNAHGGALDDQR